MRFHSGVILSKIVYFKPSDGEGLYVMTSYFNACDVIVANSKHENFL